MTSRTKQTVQGHLIKDDELNNMHLSLFKKTGRCELKTISVDVNEFIKVNI